MANINLKKGEGRWLTFTITRKGKALDLTNSDFSYIIKSDLDSVTKLLEKLTVDFDGALIATGIIKVNITPDDTISLGVGNFVSELQIVKDEDTEVYESQLITLEISPSLH